jgi:hypothetical protein
MPPTDNKSDDRKPGIYEQMEYIFDQFPTQDINTLFGEFNANVGREDIFKPTIRKTVYIKSDMIMGLLCCVKRKKNGTARPKNSCIHKAVCIHKGSRD